MTGAGGGAARQFRWALLIFLGGSAGTWLRSALTAALPSPDGSWPWAIFWINLGGSLVLGALLAGLARTGTDTGWRRDLRLALGTGLLGGFTTYSTFALDSARLLGRGAWLVGLAYPLTSVVLGLLLAWLGAAAVRVLGTGR